MTSVNYRNKTKILGHKQFNVLTPYYEFKFKYKNIYYKNIFDAWNNTHELSKNVKTLIEIILTRYNCDSQFLKALLDTTNDMLYISHDDSFEAFYCLVLMFIRDKSLYKYNLNHLICLEQSFNQYLKSLAINES